MRLVDNYPRILAKAWSIRLLALALVFDGLQYALPYLPAFFAIPPVATSAIVFFLTVGAGVARIVDQKIVEPDDRSVVSWRDGDLAIVGGRLFRAVQPTEARS